MGYQEEQTSTLVHILDGSPFFEKSEILSAAPGARGEGFQIRISRRRGK